MTIIGITGGIGSGKSTATAILKEKGAFIIDADLIAREIVEPGQPALAELAAEFGEDIVDDSGVLRRRVLAQRAFVDEKRTERLNAITHPRIAERTRELFAEAAESGAEVIVHDSALLIELGLDRAVDITAVVSAPEELRLQRLVDKRGLDEEDARHRIARQMGEQERCAAADVVLDNSGTVDELAAQVEQLWERANTGG
ncbi:dephospho-CoA kinase [Corynebacterium sp. TAE3-ERU30]|uniref:dephospho-CoA kinase n=1 Tax=Corynebacterium sp. TAE3-ERU30 TaxID=2849496 RepID=UPI001C45D11D|nr:dephospho-CoA kinase [Corynebacterium sp. TAE3-ERU30]MBV7281418.1 dephospho-CoA kinase, long form [Corynebacterium sp. TAE3-ERU30]